jgi:hypothetical protein
MGRRLALLMCVGSSLGCARTYHWAYEYQPRPMAVSVVSPPASEAQPLHVLVTVIGVRTDSAKEHPATVEVRLQLENATDEAAAIVPGSLELHSANLRPFDAPKLPEPRMLAAAPGQVAPFTVYFPFTGGDVPGGHDLNGLSLRWTVQLGEQTFTRSVTFTRREPPRPYYYRDPWFSMHHHYIYVPSHPRRR